MKRYLKKIRIFVAVILAAFVGLSVIMAFVVNRSQNYTQSPLPVLPKPQISGWIPWWDEIKAYDLIERYPGDISTASPVWYMVDDKFDLVEVGTVDKHEVVTRLKGSNVKVVPSLGSELSGNQLELFLKDTEKKVTLINSLVDTLKLIDADGLDIDLEAIGQEGRDDFTKFLVEITNRLHEENLTMSIAVHAQDGHFRWEAEKGQDLKRIGLIADEVRIMIYDEHSSSSEPGSISSFEWITNVIKHNKKLISAEKIVIGIPSYGYVWPGEDSPKGLQFYEFNEFLLSKNDLQSKRDLSSGEIVYEGDNFKGYLSDSEAMIKKIQIARSLGINRFVIWHLGGLDEAFFISGLSTLP